MKLSDEISWKIKNRKAFVDDNEMQICPKDTIGIGIQSISVVKGITVLIKYSAVLKEISLNTYWFVLRLYVIRLYVIRLYVIRLYIIRLYIIRL